MGKSWHQKKAASAANAKAKAGAKVNAAQSLSPKKLKRTFDVVKSRLSAMFGDQSLDETDRDLRLHQWRSSLLNEAEPGSKLPGSWRVTAAFDPDVEGSWTRFPKPPRSQSEPRRIFRFSESGELLPPVCSVPDGGPLYGYYRSSSRWSDGTPKRRLAGTLLLQSPRKKKNAAPNQNVPDTNNNVSDSHSAQIENTNIGSNDDRDQAASAGSTPGVAERKEGAHQRASGEKLQESSEATEVLGRKKFIHEFSEGEALARLNNFIDCWLRRHPDARFDYSHDVLMVLEETQGDFEQTQKVLMDAEKNLRTKRKKWEKGDLAYVYPKTRTITDWKTHNKTQDQKTSTPELRDPPEVHKGHVRVESTSLKDTPLKDAPLKDTPMNTSTLNSQDPPATGSTEVPRVTTRSELQQLFAKRALQQKQKAAATEVDGGDGVVGKGEGRGTRKGEGKGEGKGILSKGGKKVEDTKGKAGDRASSKGKGESKDKGNGLEKAVDQDPPKDENDYHSGDALVKVAAAES